MISKRMEIEIEKVILLSILDIRKLNNSGYIYLCSLGIYPNQNIARFIKFYSERGLGLYHKEILEKLSGSDELQKKLEKGILEILRIGRLDRGG